MLRWSMLVSWWELIRNPRGFKRRNSLGFEFGSPGGTKHMSLSRPLASEQAAKEVEAGVRRVSVPEPGDVTKRHGTMTPFDFDFDDEHGEKRKKDVDQDDVV